MYYMDEIKGPGDMLMLLLFILPSYICKISIKHLECRKSSLIWIEKIHDYLATFRKWFLLFGDSMDNLKNNLNKKQ